ncbi:hypothetical protein I4U23_015957, partial [Adineta vaga]
MENIASHGQKYYVGTLSQECECHKAAQKVSANNMKYTDIRIALYEYFNSGGRRRDEN